MVDIDGNRFVDFNNALASVTLGHCDQDVTEAVMTQLSKGTIFSLAHPLEVEVAELIIEMVPCAQAVRFGKNGSDATAGAIRAARAFTGRDRVAVCGYHGWQDWYIGTTSRNKGVPSAVAGLSHAFIYNDLESLKTLLASSSGEFAAVIMEPMNIVEPGKGFLEAVRKLAHSHGALLIFDETITGFRFANGGAQQLFGVTPDLACFGKGLANGYPLSAVAGRKDVMSEFETVFFSFTMGGETLSLAAAKATLTKLRKANVTSALRERGEEILMRLRDLIATADCRDFVQVTGHPSWSFLTLSNCDSASLWEIKTLLIQEMLARGILTLGTHNLSYAHEAAHVDRLIGAYAEILPIIRNAIREKSVVSQLRCEPLKSLFKVR